jgi:hypothetical protein
MRPLIGIPAVSGRSGPLASRARISLCGRRLRERRGAGRRSPVYLPHQGDVATLVDRLDGLLVPGGGDFAPDRSYPASVSFDLVPERQLAFDRALIACGARARPPRARHLLRHADARDPLRRRAALRSAHRRAGRREHRLTDPRARHAIRVEAASRLRSVLGAERCR